MFRLRNLRCLLVLVGVMALTLSAGSALAGSGLRYSPGPTTLYIPVLGFYKVNAELFNTGDAPDQYHLTLTRDFPEDWAVSLCYDGVCYPPQTSEFTIPEVGSLEPGASMLIELDVTKMFTEGSGSFTVSIVSENNPAYHDQVTYTIDDPGYDPIAFHFATGTTVLETDVNELARFHTALFNCGTDDDAYLLTVTRDHSPQWSSTICYDGTCYSPAATEFRIPEAGYVSAGGYMDIDIDITPMFESGLGSMRLRIASETNDQIVVERTFYVSTEGLVAVEDETPNALLSRAHAAPNPFNPRTEIRFEVGGTHAGDATVNIYDLRGRQVRTLDAGTVEPGPHSVTWDGRNTSGELVGAGAYVARIWVDDQHQDVKMSLVK